jgi:hypothetical protein
MDDEEYYRTVVRCFYFLMICDAIEFVLNMHRLHLCPIHGIERY